MPEIGIAFAAESAPASGSSGASAAPFSRIYIPASSELILDDVSEARPET